MSKNDPFADLIPEENRSSDPFADLIPQDAPTESSGGDPFADLIPKEDPLTFTEGLVSGTKATARGLAKGAIEVPKTVADLGDAATSFVFGEDVGQALFGDASDTLGNLKDSVDKSLGESDNTSEAVVEGLAQFAIPFGGASKTLKAAGMTNKGLRSIVAGTAADFIAYPDEKNLSNLLEKVDNPVLNNALTQYLSIDEDDSNLERRVKQAAEGTLLGGVIEGVLRGARKLRESRKASQATDVPAPKENPSESPVEPQKATDDVDYRPIQGAEVSVAAPKEFTPAGDGARSVTQDVSPEQVLAEGDKGKYAGNINLDRIDSPESVKDVINNISQVYKDDMEYARRGVQSFEKTEELAKLLNMDEEKLLARNRGQAFNPEEIRAASDILVTSAENVKELAKKAVGGSNSDLLAFHNAVKRHHGIQSQVAGIRAEAGRALGILRATSKSSDPKAIEKIIKDMGGRENIEDIASKISTLDDPSQLNKAVREIERSKWGDIFNETWINLLLSGLRTHVTNITSNTAVALWSLPEHTLASAFGKLHGGEKVYLRETAHRAFGMFQGAADGLQLAKKAFLTEAPSFGDSTKIEVSRHRAISSEGLGLEGTIGGKIADKVGGAIRIPGRSLMAQDEFFKSIGYRMELNSLAVREGTKKGLKGKELGKFIEKTVRNPSEEMVEKAVKAAEYQTFTNPLGDLGQSVQKFSNAHFAAKVVIPFVRTPTNIIKFALARTPAGFLMDDVKEAIKAGGAERDIALARITFGTGVAGLVANLAMDGKITGGGPKDPGEKAVLYSTGWQPYSIKIGDRYVSYARMEPIGSIFGIAADYVEISEKATDAEMSEVAAMIALSASHNILSKTWLQGASDAIQAINDPERYGSQWFEKLAGTAVPTGVAHLAQIQDPYLKDAASAIETIKGRTPGYSPDIKNRLDIFGEPIKLEGSIGPDYLSPFYKSDDRNDPIADDLVKLGLSVKKPRGVIDGVKLTPEQHWDYQRLAGQNFRENLEYVYQSRKFRNAPPYARRKVVKELLSKSREVARARMMLRYPNIIPDSVEIKMEEIKGK